MPSGRRERGGRAARWRQRCRAPWQHRGGPAAPCPAGDGAGAEAGAEAVPAGRAGPGHVRPTAGPPGSSCASLGPGGLRLGWLGGVPAHGPGIGNARTSRGDCCRLQCGAWPRGKLRNAPPPLPEGAGMSGPGHRGPGQSLGQKPWPGAAQRSGHPPDCGRYAPLCLLPSDQPEEARNNWTSEIKSC